VFPVRYELDFYISLRRNSVFKVLTAIEIYLRKCGTLRDTKLQGTKLDNVCSPGAISTLKVTIIVLLSSLFAVPHLKVPKKTVALL
jgi:hypothetical protein